MDNKTVKSLMARLAIPDDYHRGSGGGELTCPENILCFRRTSLSDAHRSASMHHRHVLVVNFATEGDIFLDEHRIHLAPGQAVLFFPFQLHHYAPCERHVDWLFITFELANDDWLPSLRNRVVTLGDTRLKSLGELLAHYLQPPDAQTTTAPFLRFCLGKLLAELCASAVCGRRQSDNGPDLARASALMPRLNRHIKGHLAGDLSCAAIGRALGMSASHLRTLVRREIGGGLGAYVRRLRMNQAMGLLAAGRHTVAEVGRLCGLGDPSSFSRAFSQYAGMSPRDFRHGRRGDQ